MLQNIEPPRPLHSVDQGPDLVDQVAEQLRQRILDGRFTVGQTLPSEGDLAQTLTVSRTVVREAMRLLRAQGLVEVSRGRRPRIKAPDPQLAIDMLLTHLGRRGNALLNLVEARRSIEAEIAALAAVRATPDQLQAMEQAVAEIGRSRVLEARVNADQRFHMLLARATGNEVFELLLGAAWQLMRAVIIRARTHVPEEVVLREHRRILQAVVRHDSDKARAAMLDHLRHTVRRAECSSEVSPKQ